MQHKLYPTEAPLALRLLSSFPENIVKTQYDVTGEIVNPQVMYKFLMPEFYTLNPPIIEDLIKKSNELVITYKLSKKFAWETE